MIESDTSKVGRQLPATLLKANSSTDIFFQEFLNTFEIAVSQNP